ncbi:MAG: ATP-binding cassette domain-containing protein, partial [Anaerolineaceae bacterium]
MVDHLLSVQDLETQFKTPEGIVHAVNGVSFELAEGETLGVVGESGCGKSVTMLSVMRLVQTPPGKIVAGKAYFRGKDLLQISSDEIRSVRGGQISMVFQDPMTSLNPVMTIGDQLAEPLMLHLNMTKDQARKRSIELLGLVGIPRAEERLK